MEFRIRVKQLREEKHISQYDLAEVLGIAQSTVGNWEAGKREPNYETTMRLADFFGVSLDYLLGRTDMRDVYKIKTPAELADVGVVEVEKSGSSELTAVEIEAIRKIIHENSKG
jgi:transcriptional regulator with XRE-family HTH domain